MLREWKKGRDTYKESPTIGEEWIKEELGKRACGEKYDEEVVRKKVDKVLVAKNAEEKILFLDEEHLF